MIVATNDSVGIGSDLTEALDVAFGIKAAQIITATGGTTPPAPASTAVPGTTPAPTRPPAPTSATGSTGGSVADLTQSALNHYNRAQQALQNGDWTTYGQELRLYESRPHPAASHHRHANTCTVTSGQGPGTRLGQ